MPTPRQRLWWLASIAAVALAAVLAWLHAESSGSPEASSGTHPLAGWFDRRPGTAVAEASEHAASNVGEVKPFNPLDTTAMPVFRVNEHGRLVIDAQTRSDLERVVALFADDKGLQKIEAQFTDLPVSGRRDLRDLYQRYVQYDQALHQAIPPGQSTLDEASKQLQTLHELRQQYFGQDAEAMFGAEEATATQLLDLMRKQTDPKASLEERAAQAQELWKKEHPGQ